MLFRPSPLTVKRVSAFLRIRRAVWALAAFAAVTVFCMCAPLVCPVPPGEIATAESLAPFAKPVVEKVYESRSARFSVDPSGAVFDCEGPEDVRKAILSCRSGFDVFEKDYEIARTDRGTHARYYLEPKNPPPATVRVLPPPAASFPFPPCKGHPFGIDSGGKDVYSSVVYGMRISLVFGLVLTLWAMLLGLVVGAIEGYFGGWTDVALQRFTEIWSAIPFNYVMIFIGSTLGRGFTVLLVCYGIFNWITVSYYMRAEFLRLRVRAFVDAAKCQGFSAWRIIFRHILPNAVTPLVTLFPFLLMGAIGSLAALDFLGFGLPPMTPSCGELMNQAQYFRRAWWLVLFPGAALFVVMFLAVIVGEGLREAFDPRGKAELG